MDISLNALDESSSAASILEMLSSVLQLADWAGRFSNGAAVVSGWRHLCYLDQLEFYEGCCCSLTRAVGHLLGEPHGQRFVSAGSFGTKTCTWLDVGSELDPWQ